MPQTVDKILSAIDERIAAIKPELDRLVAARLALTEAPARPAPARRPAVAAAPAASTTKSGAPRKRQPALTLEAAVDGVRDAIADGPMKVPGISRAIGYALSGRVRNVIRQALEQLGAEQGPSGWSLPAADPTPPPVTNGHAAAAVRSDVAPSELESAYLERAIQRELGKGPLFPHVLANIIDAPRAEVQQACERLHVGSQLERMADGRYVA